MLISEIPLGTTVLCRNIGAHETVVFEVTMLNVSDNSLAVYLKIVYGRGEDDRSYVWKRVDEVDKKLEVLDTFERYIYDNT